MCTMQDFLQLHEMSKTATQSQAVPGVTDYARADKNSSS